MEDAEILSHDRLEAGQHVLRLQAPATAVAAKPGSFIHLRCDERLAMRRPMSIMRTGRDHGWIDVLFKNIGAGTGALAKKEAGESLSMMGPIGRPFKVLVERPRALLIGGGVGIPPMVFLAEDLRQRDAATPLVIMGSEIPYPFHAIPSKIMVPGMPDGVIAAMPLMEDWGFASRLASKQGYPGCFDGYVTELARGWLDALSDAQRAEVAIYACGPTPMLRATAALANDYQLPCQVSLEEYMACAVGGCAGCTVPTRTEDGIAMKRVCVDGPVFDARSVFFD